MKKLFIYLAIALISSVMTACSSDSYLDEMIEEEEETQNINNESSVVSRSGEQQGSPAHVRIYMYESIKGYTVRISNVRIQNQAGTMETPSFGSNLEGATLSDNTRTPTFDTANGEYTSFKAGAEVKLVVTFNAILMSEDGGAEIITVNNISTSLSDTMTLSAGIYYETSVEVNAALLRLDPITFGATVQGYTDNTVDK